MNAYIGMVDLSVIVNGETLLPETSFELDQGHSLAVVGVNGAGKTTLLRVLAGILPPTSGTVLVAEEVPDDRDSRFRARVASLIGLPPFARNLTLREHMMLVSASWGSSVSEAEQDAMDTLETLSISNLSSRYPHELSSGQTQLYALASTLSRTFDVLLLDEPEQRLDSDRLGLVGDILRGIVDSGKTLVTVSHSHTLVDRIADQSLDLSQISRDPNL
jgi:ABC-2 type transport system ATP-binding protein